MSCTSQNTLNNTNGASGDDGEEWTNVPSRSGSESTTTGAEAPQTTTVLVPKKVLSTSGDQPDFDNRYTTLHQKVLLPLLLIGLTALLATDRDLRA